MNIVKDNPPQSWVLHTKFISGCSQPELHRQGRDCERGFVRNTLHTHATTVTNRQWWPTDNGWKLYCLCLTYIYVANSAWADRLQGPVGYYSDKHTLDDILHTFYVGVPPIIRRNLSVIRSEGKTWDMGIRVLIVLIEFYGFMDEGICMNDNHIWKPLPRLSPTSDLITVKLEPIKQDTPRLYNSRRTFSFQIQYWRFVTYKGLRRWTKTLLDNGRGMSHTWDPRFPSQCLRIEPGIVNGDDTTPFNGVKEYKPSGVFLWFRHELSN